MIFSLIFQVEINIKNIIFSYHKIGDSMKIVGILLRKDNTYYLNKELIEWLLENNIIPIGIISDKLENMIQIQKLCNGIILQGGSNYTEEEIEFVKHLYKNNIPTLGICLGMQMMAVACNGKLGKNILNHKIDRKYVHNVKIIKNTKLYSILNSDSINVNSRHNDYVKYTNLNVSGMSSDGIIEAIEEPKHKFFIGIQWHPESLQDLNSIKILKAYLESL